MNSKQSRAAFVSRFSDPAALILAALCLVALLGAWNYARSMPGIDYYVPWVVVDATRRGTEQDVYTPEGRYRLGREYRLQALSGEPGSRRAEAAQFVGNLHSSATPFLYAVIGLISSDDYDRDLGTWQMLSLAAFTLALLIIARSLGLSPTASLALLLPCLVWLSALHSDLRVGNVNSFQLGLVGLALWLQSRDADARYGFLAGVLVAMLVLFKPNLAPIPLLLLGAWLVRGQYRKLLIGLTGMASGALIAFAWSSVFFAGPGVWIEWLQDLRALLGQEFTSEGGNFTASNVLGLRLPGLGQVGLALALCALVLVFLWWGRRQVGHRLSVQAPGGASVADVAGDRVEYGQLLGLACLIQMLASPLVWLHYFVLTVPMLVVAFRPWSGPARRGMASLLVQRLLPVLGLLLLLEGPLGGWLASDPALAANRACVFAALILFGVGLWQLRFPDVRSPGAG